MAMRTSPMRATTRPDEHHSQVTSPSIAARTTTCSASKGTGAGGSVADVRLASEAILVVQADGYLGLAAATARAFHEVSASLHVDTDDWTYATVRDE